jgi:hypothetical protein
MKPTQERIEAALRYVDWLESQADKEKLLLSSNELQSFTITVASALASAYRELKEAINITIIENLHLADGDDCTLKQLKDVIKFKLPEEQ